MTKPIAPKDTHYPPEINKQGEDRKGKNDQPEGAAARPPLGYHKVDEYRSPLTSADVKKGMHYGPDLEKPKEDSKPKARGEHDAIAHPPLPREGVVYYNGEEHSFDKKPPPSDLGLKDAAGPSKAKDPHAQKTRMPEEMPKKKNISTKEDPFGRVWQSDEVVNPPPNLIKEPKTEQSKTARKMLEEVKKQYENIEAKCKSLGFFESFFERGVNPRKEWGRLEEKKKVLEQAVVEAEKNQNLELNQGIDVLRSQLGMLALSKKNKTADDFLNIYHALREQAGNGLGREGTFRIKGQPSKIKSRQFHYELEKALREYQYPDGKGNISVGFGGPIEPQRNFHFSIGKLKNGQFEFHFDENSSWFKRNIRNPLGKIWGNLKEKLTGTKPKQPIPEIDLDKLSSG